MTLPIMFAGSACISPVRVSVACSLHTGRSCSIMASAFGPRAGAGGAAFSFWSSWAKTAVVNRQRAAKRIGFFTPEQTGGAGEGFPLHGRVAAAAPGRCGRRYTQPQLLGGAVLMFSTALPL